jgi:hypothetical protein
VGNLGYAAAPHVARLSSAAGRLAVRPSARFGIGKGTTVPVAGPAWMPRTAVAFPVARRRQGQPVAFTEPFHQLSNGVRMDACPGHRTWSPPV